MKLLCGIVDLPCQRSSSRYPSAQIEYSINLHRCLLLLFLDCLAYHGTIWYVHVLFTKNCSCAHAQKMLQPELVDLTWSAPATWSSGSFSLSVYIYIYIFFFLVVALTGINKNIAQLITNDEVKPQQHSTASC